MPTASISRKDFIRSSSLLMATGNFLSANAAGAAERKTTGDSGEIVRLKNVRLETGFIYEDNEVSATKTALFEVEIAGETIKTINSNNPGGEGIDASGLLMLPAFKEMHIHLDKTYYGQQWKANTRRNRTVKDMIALEQRIIPELLKNSTYKAEKIIELLQSKGSHFARSHVNIDPTSQLQSLYNLQKALANKKDSFEAELVAFPQHGVYYTPSASLMKEAAVIVDYIGGLDPTSIDGSVEKQMDFIIQLATDYNKGIDIHLHEGGAPGLRTVEYLIQKVNENPGLKNKTFISHCFVLANLEERKQHEISEKLADAGIGIISTIPFGSLVMPVPLLYKYGVDVRTGNDSIVDHWNTFGSGSVLQKANLAAQLYGYRTEFDLSRILKLATHNILPLDDKGNRQWPQTGDKADFVLVDASCSAEAVSRISPVRSLVHKGKIVF
ncbi:MAG: amidohydrolase family protein [Chitinophagaceae bacterium]|nr:amidohydrolase family protein [Chitinophagaceae bacterium]MCW5929060.1 amidohydrolase family protein [Chitinophagaceae bacterium]